MTDNLPPEEVWKEHEREQVLKRFDVEFMRTFRPLALLGGGLITIGAVGFFFNGITVGRFGELALDLPIISAALFVCLFLLCLPLGQGHRVRLNKALAEVDALTAPRRAYVVGEAPVVAPPPVPKPDGPRGPTGTRSLNETPIVKKPRPTGTRELAKEAPPTPDHE